MIKRIYNRPGSRGHRNAPNSPTDKNDEGEVTGSGRKVREKHPTEKTQKRFPSRHRVERTGEKRRSGQDETRDSTRATNRDRVEFTGRLLKASASRAQSPRSARLRTTRRSK